MNKRFCSFGSLKQVILHNPKQTGQCKNAKIWSRNIKLFRLIGKEQNKLDMFSVQFKNIIFKRFNNKWGKFKALPDFAAQTFMKF